MGPAGRSQPASAGAPRDALGAERIEPLLAYIAKTWRPLTRTAADLPRAAEDAKIAHAPGTPWPIYLSPQEDRDAVAAALARVLPAHDLARIALRPLPPELPPDFEHGLLYLPRPYVVPGGRFNEMYGWDSYFIVLGLLRDERLALARGVVDDFVYEVRHYGGVLNANRTYYLTRSQPPLLAEMVVALYHATGDRAWLAGTRDALIAAYDHWLAPPHLIPALGLSRYFDHGDGPAPEVVAGERDAQGDNHYDRVRAWFRAHPENADGYYDSEADELTPLYYKGDRSMRESGFDPTGRFGPFGADVTRYAPVCLNTLLYRMERDLAEIDQALGKDAERLAGAGRGAQGPDRSAALGRRRGALLRLRLRARPPQPLPVRDDVLAAVGRRRLTGARAPRARQPAPVRAAGRDRHQHDRDRRAVGRAVRVGAAAAVRGQRPAPLRVRRRRRSHRARPGCRCWSRTSSGVARWSRSTTSNGAPPTSRGAWPSATPATRSASAGPTASRWSCSPAWARPDSSRTLALRRRGGRDRVAALRARASG